MCAYEVDGAGLNLVSLASDVFHSYPRNKSLAKQLFGFLSWNETKLYIKALFDVHYNTTRCLRPNTKGLTEFEQLLVCFTWMMLGANYDSLGIMFGGVTRNYIGIIIHRWIDVIGERGDMMSSLLPFLTEDYLEAMKPHTYNELNLDRTGGIVDGKDFDVETVRVERVITAAQHSNKTGHSAFRILTWSLPMGAVVERTPAFLGRTSKKAIMNWWGLHGCLKFPLGYMILGDKGFDHTACLHPAFLTDGNFDLSQIGHNVKICQKRYTCEVVYSRVTDVPILYGKIPRQRFHLFESIVGWAHGHANLCYEPLQNIVSD